MIDLNCGQFDIGKLTVFEQLSVARKLGPAIPIVEGLVSDRNAGKDVTLLVVLLLSRLSDEESDEIVKKCLGVVSIKQDTGCVKLMPNGVLMFSEIDLATLLQLTASVIVENLGSFFNSALASLQQGAVDQ